MMAADYYETLGVSKGASQREIKSAFRCCVMTVRVVSCYFMCDVVDGYIARNGD